MLLKGEEIRVKKNEEKILKKTHQMAYCHFLWVDDYEFFIFFVFTSSFCVLF